MKELIQENMSAGTVAYDTKARRLTIDGTIFPVDIKDMKVRTGRLEEENEVTITIATRIFTLD